MNLRTIASARPGRRPALYLTVAAAGALMANVLTAGEPAAHADAQSVSIAAHLNLAAAKTDVSPSNAVRPLEQLAASRGERDADRAAAAAARPAGSFQDYARNKVGAGQFGCLENLWGKESGWNPNAQNPSSTAYGIPQLLDSTWGGTGIAKTSDGYRQIDAGLVYIQNAYGSPCAAWGHSQSTGWY